MSEIAYFNGRFLTPDKVSISVNDSGFLYGYGCYETLRGYQGRFLRLNEHLNRLSRTAAELKLLADIPLLEAIVPETLRKSELADARVRITLTGGELSLSSLHPSGNNTTLVVTAAGYVPHPAEKYEKGFKAIIARTNRNSRSLLPGLKTTCFLESLLARREAQSAGADDALMLNERGLLVEASSSNVFIVSDMTLRTPRLGAGLLPGVTRSIVLEKARQNGMMVIETDILPVELASAEEIFLTNSMIEIMPVTSLEDKPVGTGKPGILTRRLMGIYKEMVSRETA